LRRLASNSPNEAAEVASDAVQSPDAEAARGAEAARSAAAGLAEPARAAQGAAAVAVSRGAPAGSFASELFPDCVQRNRFKIIARSLWLCASACGQAGPQLVVEDAEDARPYPMRSIPKLELALQCMFCC
jgi:hypothetical protein